MSKHGWERGEIKMSVKEFGSFRRDMVEFHNSLQTRLYTKAVEVYTALKSASKGKRNFDFHTAFDLAMLGVSETTLQNAQQFYNATVIRYGEPHEVAGYDEIQEAIFPYVTEGAFTGRSRKPKSPKKNQFAYLPLNTATEIPVGSEACISFNKKTRVITWSVAENNHSVERAHDHATGKEFFKRLSRVVWTRGTGGQIVGNDEYNRDARGAGEASNYVTNRYGVAEKEFKQSFAAMRSWRS
jgi:hypothetical protein